MHTKSEHLSQWRLQVHVRYRAVGCGGPYSFGYGQRRQGFSSQPDTGLREDSTSERASELPPCWTSSSPAHWQGRHRTTQYPQVVYRHYGRLV